MVDLYKSRGYGPIYSIDTRSKLKTASWNSYGKRKVTPNIEPRTKITRFAKPRSKGGKNNRFEVKNLKIGDIVYSIVQEKYKGGKYGRTWSSKNIIQPWVVVEIDDCYMWSRKKVTDKKFGYSTYIWIEPLIMIGGKWRVTKYKKKKIGFCHSVSINDDVFMSPEEAMWSEFYKYGDLI